MALITKLENAANVVYNGSTITSNTVNTLLLLNPIILKAVDLANAYIGDTLTYTVTITNPGLTAISSLPFSDVLPAGSTYIADTFNVNGTAATPTIAGNTISYTIPNVASLASVTITFQVTVVGGES